MTLETVGTISIISIIGELVLFLTTIIGIIVTIRYIKKFNNYDATLSTNKILLENNNLESISGETELFINKYQETINLIFSEIADEYLAKHDPEDQKTFSVTSINNLALKASRLVYSRLSDEVDSGTVEYDNAKDIVESSYFNMIIKQQFEDYIKQFRKSILLTIEKAKYGNVKVNTNNNTVKDAHGNTHFTNIFNSIYNDYEFEEFK